VNIGQLEQQRNVAVCKEVAARVRGDKEAQQQAREEWARLELEIERARLELEIERAHDQETP
jgi:hypothetical protein